jgi:hypothetical protein
VAASGRDPGQPGNGVAWAAADGGLPPGKAGGHIRAGLLVDFGQLAAERTDRAAAAALQLSLMLDEEVTPGAQPCLSTK